MITNICNSKCIYCDLWKKYPKKITDIGKFREKLKELNKEYDLKSICLIGGEITLLENLKEYTDAIKELTNANLTFPVNGNNPEQINEQVRKVGNRSLCVSLDGFNGVNLKQRITSYKNPIKTMNLLKDYCNIIVIPTITKLSYKEIPSLVKFARKNNYGLIFSVYRQDDYFNNNEDDDLRLSEEDKKEVIKLLIKSNAHYLLNIWSLVRYLKGKSYPKNEKRALFFNEDLEQIKVPENSYEPVTVGAGFNFYWKNLWRVQSILNGSYFKEKKLRSNTTHL